MEKNDDTPLPVETCASCGAKLKGDYCRKCGEKKIVPERDFSLTKFLTQTLGRIVHFDSKILRSFWLLFSKPGFLTAEWIAGRRVGYMKPLQLFIIAGLLFYFFLPNVSAYYSKVGSLKAGFEHHDVLRNMFHWDAERAMAEKVTILNLETDDLEDEVNLKAALQSKTWLFLVIPVWGALIFLFYRKKIPWLAPHLIFAMHGLTVYILTDLLVHLTTKILSITLGMWILLPLNLTLFIYLVFATRCVYGSAWPESVLKTLGITACFIVLLMLYRQLMTISSIVWF